MSTLVLADDLAQDVQRDLARLTPIPATTAEVEGFRVEVTGLLRDRREYDHLATILRDLLGESGFVHLRGFPDLGDLRGIVTLGSLLGELFADLSHQATLVVEASPAPGATLQGNRTGALFPHTDFAMLERPPAVTLLRCATEDPLGAPFGVNGVMLAQHIIDHFFGAEWLPLLWTVPLPFAGRKPSGENVVFGTPVLDVEPGSLDVRSVRFHPSRVHHGFRVRGQDATPEEAAVLQHLLSAARAVRQEVYLCAGDYLIVSNRRALHDRGRCSLRLGRTGWRARVSQILFVQDYHAP
jgi:alpha-ketoglutarate-dependent taurine dioxygenase